MKKIVVFVIFGFFSANLFAQNYFWVYIKDKGEVSEKTLSIPENFLSKKSIKRKILNKTPISYSDLPVNNSYKTELSQFGKVIFASRWLNAVCLETSLNPEFFTENFDFVSKVKPIQNYNVQLSSINKQEADTFSNHYGYTDEQNEQINLQCLHDQGFTGNSIFIGVFDAGFFGINASSYFDHLWTNGQIKSRYDFYDNDTTVIEEGNHGAWVFSIMAAMKNDTFIGAAPHADYFLARTEIESFEKKLEEVNWQSAVEFADSIGVDIINSSLSYSTFDNSADDYSYSDLDGQTPLITQAAKTASRKGIIVVNSAGNEGTSSWHYICAPCDADSIICVGAVNSSGTIAPLSSRGPTADGRIKPDVVAMGQGTYYIRTTILTNDTLEIISSGSGTSFSAPIIAGAMACLKQANPTAQHMTLINSLIQSSDRFTTPDNDYGHGIPDLCKADSIVKGLISKENEFLESKTSIKIYPTITNGIINIADQNMENIIQSILIFDLKGNLLKSVDLKKAQYFLALDISEFTSGVYLVKITDKNGELITNKIVKQ